MSVDVRQFEGFLINSNFDVFKKQNQLLNKKIIKNYFNTNVF